MRTFDVAITNPVGEVKRVRADYFEYDSGCLLFKNKDAVDLEKGYVLKWNVAIFAPMTWEWVEEVSED